ncbi:hypothetical protein AJ80_03628 [Polytolypa hystricis UAMH7299]|uniref:Aminoglycoside phosphotransferase domain-containing protein n=1 Tax=Polytolypa hystricis (strain UAMH7299) TaxID=1447883 RepID=A0A2B7YGQ8_POLH7|nr:hypothetical protein AJ80_03628 [Polytolypa hystricis UAMH7299]
MCLRSNIRNSFLNPIIFKNLMPLCEDPSRRNGSFYLANRDFGPRNILIDDDFNVVGVIDFDGIISAPIEVAAQFPRFSAMDMKPPGIRYTNEHWAEQTEQMACNQQVYKAMVLDAESRLDGGKGRDHLLANALLANPTVVYHGIEAYSTHQESVNDAWMKARQRLANARPPS